MAKFDQPDPVQFKVRPIGDYVVVRPDKAEEKTPGGIVLPDGAGEKPQRGTVFAVGKGVLQNGIYTPLEVDEGDVVMYGRYGSNTIKVGEEEFLVMRQADILCVIGNVPL